MKKKLMNKKFFLKILDKIIKTLDYNNSIYIYKKKENTLYHQSHVKGRKTFYLNGGLFSPKKEYYLSMFHSNLY
jgi:hypothetical protein